MVSLDFVILSLFSFVYVIKVYKLNEVLNATISLPQSVHTNIFNFFHLINQFIDL